MLSYQHIYHAGNPADLHKHMLLAWVLDYLTGKEKPISYIETHAGRGLYALDAPEALKTGEAAAGILRALPLIPAVHPFMRALDTTRQRFGPMAYPGSPLIAATLLRPQDKLTLAELHPQEHAALRRAMRSYRATVHASDGLELLRALLPPTPRRGVLMIDPSYEVKTDYAHLPDVIAHIRRTWNVGVILLWYPLLTTGAQMPMLEELRSQHPDALFLEAGFPPVRPGHRMIGSGMMVINPPWGLEDEAARVNVLLAAVPDASPQAQAQATPSIRAGRGDTRS